MNTLQEIKKKVITNEWVESKDRGKGGVGITLESLLQKERENFELPDYKGIELKAKYSKRETYITLFSATPDSYLFETKRLLQEYGYPDNQYPQFKMLNLSVYGNRKVKIGKHYFKLYVDWDNQKIVLRVYDKSLNVIDELTAWSFQMLQEKLERKLSKLAIIHADRKFQHNTVFFKYTNIEFYDLISFERFLTLIENGIVRISFRLGVYKNERKFGKIYDHGTSFSIDEANITRLFTPVLINGSQGE